MSPRMFRWVSWCGGLAMERSRQLGLGRRGAQEWGSLLQVNMLLWGISGMRA